MIVWVDGEREVEDPYEVYDWERGEVACPNCGDGCSDEFPCWYCEGRGRVSAVVFYDEHGFEVAYEVD